MRLCAPYAGAPPDTLVECGPSTKARYLQPWIVADWGIILQTGTRHKDIVSCGKTGKMNMTTSMNELQTRLTRLTLCGLLPFVQNRSLAAVVLLVAPAPAAAAAATAVLPTAKQITALIKDGLFTRGSIG